MSVIDQKMLFSDVEDIGNGSVGTDISENTLDLGVRKTAFFDNVSASAGNPNIGNAPGLVLNLIVEDEALLASSTSGTLIPKLFTKASASSMASGTLLLTGPTTTYGAVPASSASSDSIPDGTVLWKTPLPIATYLRFLAVGYTTATKKLIGGKVTCWIGLEAEKLT